MTAPERILVFQPAYLGDVVFASPLTAALGAAWPNARLAFVARPPGDAIARFLPGVSEVFVYDKRGRDRGLTGLGRIVRRIREFSPDLFISLHGSVRSGLIARLSGAALRVGPARLPGSFGFTRRVRWGAELTFTGRALALGRAVGVEGEDRLGIVLPGALLKGSQRFTHPTVALIPGSVWPTKRWPVVHAGRLATFLGELGYEVLVLGSEAERALCQEVVSAGGPACHNLAGTSIEEALALLKGCRAAIGGDSGLSHAARALGLPVATLFGPTSPARHEPSARDLFISLGLSCSPCSEHGQERCPLGHHDCLQKLSPELVRARLLPVLQGSDNG